MKRMVIALSLLLLAACSTTHVTVIPAKLLPQDVYPQGGGKRLASREQRVTIYLFQGDRLAPVSRVGRSRLPQPELVLRALLAGPSQAESDKHISTAVPASVELTSVTSTNGIADVDLNAAFKTPAREDFIRRVAQIVYTLDELQDVDSVRLFVDGHRLLVLDQNGNERTDPVSRGSYSRYGPKAALGAPVSEGPLRLDMPGEEEAAVP